MRLQTWNPAKPLLLFVRVILTQLQLAHGSAAGVLKFLLTGCTTSPQVWSDGAAYTGPRWVGLADRPKRLEVYSLQKQQMDFVCSSDGSRP